MRHVGGATMPAEDEERREAVSGRRGRWWRGRTAAGTDAAMRADQRRFAECLCLRLGIKAETVASDVTAVS